MEDAPAESLQQDEKKQVTESAKQSMSQPLPLLLHCSLCIISFAYSNHLRLVLPMNP